MILSTNTNIVLPSGSVETKKLGESCTKILKLINIPAYQFYTTLGMSSTTWTATREGYRKLCHQERCRIWEHFLTYNEFTEEMQEQFINDFYL